MTKTTRAIFFALLSCFVLLAAIRGALPFQLRGDSVAGGRIYDNWAIALDLPPVVEDHPLWALQETNPRSGAVTWRCVECHGWDYKGAQGAYGPGSSHYTGFPGLGGMVGATRTEVFYWLDGTNNPNHDFISLLTPEGADNLVAFLLTKQVDTDLLFDRRTGAALGDPGNGRSLYRDSCESCHGEDGREINFGSGANPIHLGDLSDLDPALAVHMIRFGDPYGVMPASEDLGWSLGKVVDVLAYAQTLPRSNPTLSLTASISQQGEIAPVIWGAFAIFLVILIGTAWDDFRNKQAGSGD